ncbi:ISAs1 family transposase [Streptosporangium sp. NBC_01756]|uniref:ISAs1 family transposase n=1 Tax=Streptosporangium sp. NBC_01756 TaxID=2975950 RepID=UPI002DD94F0D|nr:ISAs1 family transposase [Streptosporangium sp. NBC_01756]WSC86907.1 ISAs1 family transposase [Streptosporangium sp. NBC_01756]
MSVSHVLDPADVAAGSGQDLGAGAHCGPALPVTQGDSRPDLGSLGLAQALALLEDPRDPRGVWHPLVAVLLIAAVAVLAGAKNLLAIAERAADLSQDQLRRSGAWQHPVSGRWVAPSYGTLSRILHEIDAAVLDRLVGGWLLGRARTLSATSRLAGVALDGKVLRGAWTAGRQLCLLQAVLAEPGVTIAQVAVPDDTTETTQVQPLLEPVDIAGMVATADAAHTNPATASYLVEIKKAAHVLPVKGNTPGLLAAVSARLAGPSIAWDEYVGEEAGRGRIERRTLRVADIDPERDGIDFPHVAQVWRLRRDVLGADRRPLTKQIVFGITCLTPPQATPAELAALIRGQWAVECVHWLRDVLYREDESPLVGAAAQAMATLRNISVGMIRLSGEKAITSTTRSMGRDIGRALALLGL